MFFVLTIASVILRSPGDSSLIARLRNRDPEAMGEIYDLYGRVVYSVIVRIVKNEAVAEELVQETFLRVWNRVAAFNEERGMLGPWLLTVARNQAVDYLRSVEGRAQRSGAPIDEMVHPPVLFDIESDLHDAVRLTQIRTALSKLTEQQRRVIELAYFEGLSQSEMAERMKQPLGTVKTWMRAALKTLREALNQSVPA